MSWVAQAYDKKGRGSPQSTGGLPPRIEVKSPPSTAVHRGPPSTRRPPSTAVHRSPPVDGGPNTPLTATRRLIRARYDRMRVNTGVLCSILMYSMCIAYRIAHVFSMYSHHIMTCIGCTHIGMYYACIMHVFLAYSIHILPL